MNILVCAKEVFHPLDLQLPGQGTGTPAGLRMPNRADECAVDLAARLCESGGGRVTLVSIAPPEAEETLERIVGLGADALTRVWDDALTEANAGGVTRVLAKVVERLRPDLVLCADRAVSSEGSGLTGPLLAEALGWPFAGGAVGIEADKADALFVYRLIERGDRQQLSIPLPAVVAVSPESPSPGYPALARIRRAARESLDLASLGLERKDLESAALPMSLTDWAAAKPRPKKLFTPPSAASAADRLKMVMGGGMAKKTQDNLVDAPAEKAAEQILLFLRQEKLL